MNPHIDKILAEIKPYRSSLLSHPLYNELKDLNNFRLFMEHHVFAVWDFMTLLKALQIKLTGMSLPWTPAKEPMVARLINDIVLAEESDEDGKGGYCSHFELYLRAMKEAGSDTTLIDNLIEKVSTTGNFSSAIASIELPSNITHFLWENYRVVEEGKPHEIAASFTLGREDLIPDLFRQLVNDHIKTKPEELDTLAYYFDRHIHLDEDHHGPLAMKMLVHLCGDDETRWEETKSAAIHALEARKVLWDGIYDAVLENANSQN
ncbi:DUF3050 domain-containing protein [Anditalea andensis]|uniref:Heme oxygenase n=1 Tax=Anditalea andensis TaxID=1048983 RepID=A0A074L2K4_9BACT|nr:DUF3050 domain-containing protein [Anditalea andensis]KEO74690.1 heme oxygenase [Anditalea andensis]